MSEHRESAEQRPNVTGKRPGFLLLEVLLGIVVFSIFLGAAGVTLLSGQQGTMMGGDRVRGTYAALRGLEAVRSIRHKSFSSLTAGQKGVRIGSDNKWEFNGTSQVFSGGYLNAVHVNLITANLARITSSTQWTFWPVRSGMTTLTTDLTNWTATGSVANWSSITLEGAVTPGGTPLFNRIAVKGNYAYVTSMSGNRIYVFDISNTAAPVRVANTLSIGKPAYGIAIRGDRLYVGTDDSNEEIMVFNISSPATLTTANQVATVNIDASPIVYGMAFRGDMLIATIQFHGSFPEVFAFRTTTGGTVTQLGTLDIGANVYDVAISGTGAYIATDADSAEFRLVNITSGGNLRLQGTAYNFTGTEDGRAVAISGTSALMGRARGTGISEVSMLNTTLGGGSPPAANYYEGSGAVLDIDFDSTGCYAFIPTQSVARAFRVINFKNIALPELTSWNSNATYGQARAVYYDFVRDRVYVATDTSFLVFRPAAGTGPCS